MAAWAGAHGIATLTDEALSRRLHRTGPFLEALRRQLRRRVGAATCWHDRVLLIADSTSLSGPASTGTDWRIHGVFVSALGRFASLQVTDRHGGEGLDRGRPVAGEIRIADRGHADAKAWPRYLRRCEAQADFIVRMRWNTIRLSTDTGDAFDLIAWLKQNPSADKGDVQEVAEWGVPATSLPADACPAAEDPAVHRLRWQVELAVKRLNSSTRIGQIRTRTEAGTRGWLYGLLVVARLTADPSQDVLDAFPLTP